MAGIALVLLHHTEEAFAREGPGWAPLAPATSTHRVAPGRGEMRTELFELYIKILDDPKLDFDQKRKMLDEVRNVMSPEQNRWNFRYVILPLAAVALTVPIYFVAFLVLVKPHSLHTTEGPGLE